MSDLVKIDAKYWHEILSDKKKAKEALVGLTMPNGAKVEFVKLEDGSQIKTSDVTEDQAHAFMSELCPTWAKQ